MNEAQIDTSSPGLNEPASDCNEGALHVLGSFVDKGIFRVLSMLGG